MLLFSPMSQISCVYPCGDSTWAKFKTFPSQSGKKKLISPLFHFICVGAAHQVCSIVVDLLHEAHWKTCFFPCSMYIFTFYTSYCTFGHLHGLSNDFNLHISRRIQYSIVWFKESFLVAFLNIFSFSTQIIFVSSHVVKVIIMHSSANMLMILLIKGNSSSWDTAWWVGWQE